MLDIIERSPMKTHAYDLIFDFGPNMFDRSKLMPAQHQYYGVFEDDDFVGFGKIVDYKGYFSGNITHICYFGNCFIHPEHQRKGYFTQLIEFLIIEFNRSSPSSVGYFVYLKGNRSVEKFFSMKAKEIETMPVVKHFYNLKTKTVVITRKKKTKSLYNFRLSENNDREKIESFLEQHLKTRALMPLGFGYHTECSYLIAEHNGNILGVCEIVDLQKYKQTRIQKYKKGYWLLFHSLRFVQNILGYPIFPNKSEAFKELYINRIVFAGEQEAMELDFVNWVYNYCYNLKYNLLHIGSYADDPILKRLKGFLSLNIEARVLSVHRPQSASQFDLSKDTNTKPFIDFKLL